MFISSEDGSNPKALSIAAPRGAILWVPLLLELVGSTKEPSAALVVVLWKDYGSAAGLLFLGSVGFSASGLDSTDLEIDAIVILNGVGTEPGEA